VTFELGRALLVSGAVSTESLAQALFAVATQGLPLARALVSVGAIGELRLEEELARANAPFVRHVRPVPELMERLPAGICMRLAAIPVRLDPLTGTVDVAVLDAWDPHPAEEIGYQLHAPVRAVRASLDAMRDAMELYPGGMRALAAPMSAPPNRPEWMTRTPAWGTPIFQGLGRDNSSDRPPPLPPGEERESRASDVPIPLSRRASAVRMVSAWDDPIPEPEPVFELRRGPPPPTERDPTPPPLAPSAPPPAFPLRAPLAPRVPFAPNAPIPPFADAGAFLAAIKTAQDRDAVVGLVLLGVRAVARKVGILVVRRDTLAGWSCTPEFGDESAFRQVRVPLNTPSLLTTVMGGGLYLGPLIGPVAAPVLNVMKSSSRDVAIASVRLNGRAALVVIADELGDTLLGTKRIEELARAAGDALERVVRTKRV
jgi:hypothetical protein